jgi:hypothetical protein
LILELKNCPGSNKQLNKEPDYRDSVQVNDKIFDVPKMWQNERLQQQNNYKKHCAVE